MPRRKLRVWGAKSIRYLVKTPYMSLRCDQVMRPDGKVSPYYVVERGDFAIVVARFPNNDTLFVRQHRYPLGKATWEFPMGRVHDVSLRQMAQVELMQETGYAARKLKKIGMFHVGPGMMAQRAHIYLAEDLYEQYAPPDDGEFLVVKRLPLRTVAQWFCSGKIIDGPSVLAWQAFQNHVQQHSNRKSR